MAAGDDIVAASGGTRHCIRNNIHKFLSNMEPCRAAGLPASTSEATPDVGSTIEEPVAEEDSLTLDEIYDQLEEMKQRALQLRKALVRTGEQPATAERIKRLEDIKAPGSQNAEVRQVQLQTMEIASQVADLARRLKSEGNRLKNLDCRIQENQQQTQKLNTETEKLHSWPKCQKHQAAICLERYNDIGIAYCSHEDYRSFVQKAFKTFHVNNQPTVHINCHKADKLHVIERLQKMRKLMNTSAHLLAENENSLKKYNRDVSIIPKSIFGSIFHTSNTEEEEVVQE